MRDPTVSGSYIPDPRSRSARVNSLAKMFDRAFDQLPIRCCDCFYSSPGRYHISPRSCGQE
jgi:hypothetical protein